MRDGDDPIRRAIASNPELDPTRARPEPWFVGRGTGLMIGVLSLCAFLIVVRVASVIWVAEEAWAWWAHRDDPPPPPLVFSYQPADWFVADSYPAEAIRREEQGRAVVKWTVSPQGRAIGCRVAISSGSASLDAATCAIIMRNGRIRPVLGAPTQPEQTNPVRWVLPEPDR